MAGTRKGGKKASETNKKRYGEDFYRKVGALGGKLSKGGGFTNNPELASTAGRKGGANGKRGRIAKIKTKEAWRELKLLDNFMLEYEEI